MRHSLRSAVLLLALAVGAGGCSNRDPAEAAIKSAEDVLAAIHEDAQEYAPDGYREIKAQLDAARTLFREERYAEAIAALQDLPARASVLATAAAAARERRQAELGAAWAGLAATLPGMIGTIELRLEELDRLRRLPQGIDRQFLEEAGAALASAREAWDGAGRTHAAGNLKDAVAQAQDVQALVQELMARLGIQPG